MLAANGKRPDLSKRRLDVAPIIVSQMATGGLPLTLPAAIITVQYH
jgi:hypothetical protein